MPRLGGMSRRMLALFLALALVAAGTGYYYVAQSLPQTHGRALVPGLQATAEVIRDRWGVPHVYAQSEHDLFFAQGYVQAQDRLWQMELQRRAAHGTLAEVLGQEALAGDRLARILGFTIEARAEWEGLDPETRTLLEAYAKGVNAFLSSPDEELPIEFSLLDYEPQPWQPLDTLAWARLLAWSQDASWEAELLAARLVRAVGAERAAELEPGIVAGRASLASTAGLAAVDQALLLGSLTPAWPWASAFDVGGSSWAVAGTETAHGSPILAVAPSTPAQMPSPWYEMHLTGGRYDVIGATVPGIPGVVVGRNRSIAWGLVGSGADNMDLYVERTRPGKPPQAQYQGDWESMRARDEDIRVRDRADPVRLTVYETRHGPLVTAFEAGASGQLALRWVGAGQPTAYPRCLLALNRASSWDEFQAALQEWVVPAQAVVYADALGQVGHAVAAWLPKRAGGESLLPMPGWTGQDEWQGVVPTGALSRGLVAGDGILAVDGLTTPHEWPTRPGEDVSLPTEARRIAELLAASDGLAVEDAEAIQCDSRGVEPVMLSQLLALPPQGWLQERTTPYLREWDLQYDAESVGAGVYETFYWRLLHNTLDDELGADLVDDYLHASSHHRAFMEELSTQEDSPWFDDLRTPEREGRDEILVRSYADALDWLGRRFGDLPYEWNWGRVHSITFEHPLGEQWPLNLLLNRGAMQMGGGPDCPNATSPDYAEGLAVQAVPGYRLVVDLGSDGDAAAMNATGQSGNPFSRHYADMVEPWRQGEYHPLLFEREAILQAREGILTLAPAG
jgi:penicillin amidase